MVQLKTKEADHSGQPLFSGLLKWQTLGKDYFLFLCLFLRRRFLRL